MNSVGQVDLPGRIALLEAQAVHGVHAEVAHPLRRARADERPIDRELVLERDVQLEAELADVIDAQREQLGEADLEPARREPGEGRVGEIGGGDLAQHLAGPRARQHQRAVARRHVLDDDALARLAVAEQPLVVMPFGAAALNR